MRIGEMSNPDREIRTLAASGELHGLVYHSPASGAYRLPSRLTHVFLQRMWMGPADIFFFDVTFRWSLSLTHHGEVILQFARVDAEAD